jgi:hypothetical protein
MAGMVIESLYSEKIDPELRKDVRAAMYTACKGNSKRYGGFHGDDMRPSYTNVSSGHPNTVIPEDRLKGFSAMVTQMCLYLVCRNPGRRPGSDRSS